MNVFSNIGVTEIVIILLIALLVVGPERLPEMARQAGKLLRDLRKAYDNLTRDLGPEMASFQKTALELRQGIDAVRTIPQDLARSVVQAAEADGTAQELKEAAGSVRQAGQALSSAGQSIKAPLQVAAGAVSAAPAAPALPAPAAPAPPAPATAPEPEPGSAAEPPAAGPEGEPHD
jgi:sec-independent protein translocase protein TatB